MWSFKIGHSTLQVMLMLLMVPMVCSAPVCKPEERRMILRKTNDTVHILKEKWKNTGIMDTMVPKPLSDDHNCPDNFFCLAEKVLENAREENVDISKLSKLTTNFKQYNTHCSTNCTLEKGHWYTLEMFLTDVDTCVRLFLKNKPHNKPHKK